MAQRMIDPAQTEGATSIHHYLCAFVGPPQSYAQTEAGLICPKCQRPLDAGGRDWEILEDPLCRYPG